MQMIDPSSPQEIFVCQITRLNRQKNALGVAHVSYPCDFTHVSGRCLPEMERQSRLSCDGDGRQRGPQRPGGRVRLELG
jgi:hypothetical protein